MVTSTDLPGGLGSREISDKVGGHRGSSIYHIDHDVLARLEPGPDPHPGPRRCLHRVLHRGKRRGARDGPGRPSAVAGTAEGRRHPQRRRHGRRRDRPRAARIGGTCAGWERLGALPGPHSDGPRVVFVEWLDPLSPGGHWVPEQIGYAGGTSVFLGPGANSVPVPRSYVAYNPSSPNGHRRLRTPASRWP